MKHITTADLMQMANTEGLILQGCGGDPNDWVTGINETLTQEGILLDGDTFKDIYLFDHVGLTNILFSMEDVRLDVGKLALWRLHTHGSFGGTWLSDYLPNRLGVRGEEDLTPEQDQTGTPAAMIGAQLEEPTAQPAPPIITVSAYNKALLDERDGIADTDAVTELLFPTTKEDIKARLAGIGMDGVRYKAIELDEGWLTLPGIMNFALPMLSRSSIDELNFLAAKIQHLNTNDLNLFAAALEAKLKCGSVAEIINLTDNLSGMELQPAFNAAQYGEFLLDDAKDNTSAAFRRLEASNNPEDRELVLHILEVEAHIDAESFGQAAAEREQGVFTDYGYLTTTGRFEEFYQGPEDIPSKYCVFAYPEPEPPISVKGVDLAPLLMKLHAVRGGDMSDAEYNLGVLSSRFSDDYLLIMNRKLSLLTEAAQAYRHASYANDIWRTTEGGPDTLAVAIHVTRGDGRLTGDVVLLDFTRQREEILSNSILPIHIDAIDAVFKDSSEKTFTPVEWDALQQFERDSIRTWTFRFVHEQTDAIDHRIAEISGQHEVSGKPVSEDAFLAKINAAYMAQSQNPQPDMLRVLHPAAREMLARGDAEVFRLTPDDPEALVQMDAVRSGLWYSFNREFAIRRADMDGLDKWAGRVAGDIQRKNERGEHKKSHEAEI